MDDKKLLAILDKMHRGSGLSKKDFWEKTFHDWYIQRLADDTNEKVSKDLRKHFKSDVDKLQTALNSILATFTGQMENISVEKNKWELQLKKEKEARDQKYASLEGTYKELRAEHEKFKEESSVREEEINAEKKRYEEEIATASKKVNLAEGQVKDKEKTIEERKNRIEELEGEVGKHKDEIAQKNQEILDKIKEIEELRPLSETNKKLKSDIKQMEETHAAALKQKDVHWQNEVDKAVTKREKDMLPDIRAAEEKAWTDAHERARTEMTAIYAPELDKLRDQNQKHIETIASLKQELEQLRSISKKEEETKTTASTKKDTKKTKK
ncbi:hypothetical protein [Neobacillus sp. PS3-40]|uniref:hypothetical protein n=1 Tax=Neobacillus sp. PS3-40 TaxID=3070679 RepID=UPI0027E1C91D|nr:hypothetical protein [Neobacillus sp. PS3-40]WML45405.1 hypothetical protein RCG20_05750 [Neobacillus sp. PS3-40]